MPKPTSIGIRREDKNIWEKRAPLIPAHIRELIRDRGLSFSVQSSSNRIFADNEYEREGARITDDLKDCRLVLAIKEIPPALIEPDKTYLFFSHTVKGQTQNMPLLKRMMDLKTTLIEYERISDDQGRRLLFFGTQAGQAGMIETLHALGRRLDAEGVPNPFAEILQPYCYGSLTAAKEAIERIGWRIHQEGLNRSIVPLVCGFAGYGHTSMGAQEIFDLLPCEEIPPEKLKDFAKRKGFSASRVYKTVFREQHMVRPLQSGNGFELQDYYQRPERYRSVFADYLPFLTVIMNCIYWEPRFPRFVPVVALSPLFKEQLQPRLRVIGDISCDIEGSVECTRRVSTPDKPFFLCDPLTGEIRDTPDGRGVLIMSIDNLPAEIPRESSLVFSKMLKPFLPDLAAADFSGPFESLRIPDPIRRAVVVYRGELTPDYKYLNKFLGIS